MRKKIICTALLICMLQSGASALTISNSDYENGTYTLSGKTDIANIPVKIEILQNGVFLKEAAPSTNENILTNYMVMDMRTSDADGTFLFDVPITETTGNYIVKVSDLTGDEEIVYFKTYTDEDTAQAVNTFLADSDKTVAKLETLTKSYYIGLGVDYEDVVNLTAEEKTEFLTNALGDINSDATSETLGHAINSSLALTVLRKNGKVEELSKYEESLDIKYKAYYDDYKLLSDTEKAEVAMALKGSTDVETALEDAVILQTLKNQNWSNLEVKLTQYNDSVKCALSDVAKLTDAGRQQLYMELVKILKNTTNPVTSITQIPSYVTVLTTQYKDYGKNTGGSNGSGGGGGFGGGSTGGFSSSVKKPEVSKPPFNDLESVSWAAVEIIQLYEANILKGDGAGRFRPNDTVTREEFIAMLVRALGLDTKSKETGFTDVPTDRWSSEVIAAARENDIVNGITDTVFGAENNIIRCDMAVMAYNALNKLALKAEDVTLPFSDDSDIPEYSKDAVKVLSSLGIIKGNEGKFLPKDNATRAEAAVIIHRVIEQISKN